MPALRTIASLVIAAMVAACAAPAPTPPPKADAAAIEQEIKAVVASWNEAIAARNDSAIGELYTADGVLMPPNQPRVAGKEAIRAWFAGMWVIDPKMVITTTHVVPSDAGDVAVEEGTFALEYPGADGKPINDTGKYIVVWRKTDAGWKVVRDIFNTDLPPAAPAAAK